MGLLIDSTVFVSAERAGRTIEQFVAEIEERWDDPELGVSIMSAGELFHGCWRAETSSRRARREEFVASVLTAIPVIAITLPTMRIFGEIDARLCAHGQRVPTADLLIGCTALVRGDDVVTGNPRHFGRIPGLRVRTFK